MKEYRGVMGFKVIIDVDIIRVNSTLIKSEYR